MREEGAGALFRGLTPVMIRAFPANAVSLKSWLTRRHIRELKAKTTSTTAKTSSEHVTSRFCNHFSTIPSHYARKICFKYHGINLESALQRQENRIENLSSTAHVVGTTAKQVDSCRRKDKNGYEIY